MSEHRRPRILVLLADDRADGASGAQAATGPTTRFDAYDVDTLVVTERYGRARKLGFYHAAARGYDIVVVLGEHRQDTLEALVRPLLDGGADAVYGSRRGRTGGLLSRLQNRLLRTTLEDFDTDYRAYATAALKRIPYEFNTDDRHFDTEITAQLLIAGQRILEVPVAVERPVVAPGFTYARNALTACLKARAQELSLFFDRKFDCLPSTTSNLHYKPRLGFDSTHTRALARIPEGARVLDIGCAGGDFGRLLRERRCHTTGVDRLPLDAGDTHDEFHLHDLNKMPLPVDVSTFDYAVMLDVLEHLQSPETFVDEFRAAAARNPETTLIVSTANVAFVVMRLMLLAGQFNYGKRGILDLTHTRLFTFGTFRRLFEQSGYEILELQGVPAPLPLALGRTRLAGFLMATNRLLIKVSRSLFAFQIFAVVRPKPGLAFLLDDAVKAAGRRTSKSSEAS